MILQRGELGHGLFIGRKLFLGGGTIIRLSATQIRIKIVFPTGSGKLLGIVATLGRLVAAVNARIIG